MSNLKEPAAMSNQRTSARRQVMVKAEDFRIIFKSDQIVNSPFAYLSDLPADLKTAKSAAGFAGFVPKSCV